MEIFLVWERHFYVYQYVEIGPVAQLTTQSSVQWVLGLFPCKENGHDVKLFNMP